MFRTGLDCCRSARGNSCTGRSGATPPACLPCTFMAVRVVDWARAATGPSSTWPGAGSSDSSSGAAAGPTPLAGSPEHDLQANTTGRLIDDIEALRVHLGVDRWLVNGVSWGSTLGIAYAQAHPGRVSGIVLVAVTTTSAAEVEWITETVGAIFPEEWDRFAAHAENAGIGYERGHGQLVDAYARLLDDPNPSVRDAASRAWARWEDVHISLPAGGVRHNPRWEDGSYRVPFCTLTAHYWSHNGFFDPPLLDTMDGIGHIPAILIHGRADVSGPMRTAWNVHNAWPASSLRIIENEGHGGPAMVEEWKNALTEMAERAVTRTH